MKKNRTIFIGDIHGCFDELMSLLEKIDYKAESDRLISVGDLVHKGPKSSQVIDFFIENNLEVIMGNHDWHFFNALSGKGESYFMAEEFVRESKFSKDEVLSWLSQLPFYIEDDDFIAVHGALNPASKKFYKTSPKDMMNGRYFDRNKAKVLSKIKKDSKSIAPWYEEYPLEKLKDRFVIFGHWAQKDLVKYKNFRGLDTGCCYGGRLSCLILPDDKIVQVKSKQPRMFDY